ncbi:hypothetical protein HRbin20_01739 [bacterium HR20]|nr:hypothetical protein HRbin20_01739 [bacterium HR20]
MAERSALEEIAPQLHNPAFPRDLFSECSVFLLDAEKFEQKLLDRRCSTHQCRALAWCGMPFHTLLAQLRERCISVGVMRCKVCFPSLVEPAKPVGRVQVRVCKAERKVKSLWHWSMIRG